MLRRQDIMALDKRRGASRQISSWIRITTPAGEQYAGEFETFKTTHYEQKAVYRPDSDQNVRGVEDYKNVRDLKKMRTIDKN